MLADRNNAINGEKGEIYFSMNYGLNRNKDAIISLIDDYNIASHGSGKRLLTPRDFDGITTLYHDYVDSEIVHTSKPKVILTDVKMKKKLTKLTNSTTIEMANLLKHSYVHEDFLLSVGRHNGNGEMIDNPLFFLVRSARWNQAFAGFDASLQKEMIDFCYRFENEIRAELIEYKVMNGIHMKKGDRTTYRRIFENDIIEIQNSFRNNVPTGFKPLRKFNTTNSRFQLGATINALKSVSDLVPCNEFKMLIRMPNDLSLD